MKRKKFNYFILSIVIITLVAIFITKAEWTITRPTKTIVSISNIEENPNLYKDKLVRIRGYGVTVATIPLCDGYVGMDKRIIFRDSQNNSIVTVVKESLIDVYDKGYENLRLFEGYVRIFDSQIGCPGKIRTETFPYFEIIGVE